MRKICSLANCAFYDDAIVADCDLLLKREILEIMLIVFEGGLKRLYNIGNKAIVRFGEAQVMSAMTGIRYSEMSATEHSKPRQCNSGLFRKNKT